MTKKKLGVVRTQPKFNPSPEYIAKMKIELRDERVENSRDEEERYRNGSERDIHIYKHPRVS